MGNLVSNLRAGTYVRARGGLVRGGQAATPIEGEDSRGQRRVGTAQATSGRGRRGAQARFRGRRDMREARLWRSRSRLFGSVSTDADLTVGVIAIASAGSATRSAARSRRHARRARRCRRGAGWCAGSWSPAIASGHLRDRSRTQLRVLGQGRFQAIARDDPGYRSMANASSPCRCSGSRPKGRPQARARSRSGVRGLGRPLSPSSHHPIQVRSIGGHCAFQ